jgi:hypothetical protein
MSKGAIMGNLNFSLHAGFSWYCLLLMFSGIAMLVLAAVRNQTRSRQVIRAIFGLGFFLYGFYLTFIFSGGHYVIFFQVLILPVLLIVDWYKTQTARRRAAVAASGNQGPAS